MFAAFVTNRTDTAIFGEDAEYWDVMFFEDGSTERVPLKNMAMTGHDDDAWQFNREWMRNSILEVSVSGCATFMYIIIIIRLENDHEQAIYIKTNNYLFF